MVVVEDALEEGVRLRAGVPARPQREARVPRAKVDREQPAVREPREAREERRRVRVRRHLDRDEERSQPIHSKHKAQRHRGHGKDRRGCSARKQPLIDDISLIEGERAILGGAGQTRLTGD